MSLATTSGMGAAGAGGGGLTMAYQANNIGQGAAPPPPQAGNATGPSGGPIFLGMDVSDKNQSITLRQVKNVAHLPLVGIDLHATDPLVAYFPPKTEFLLQMDPPFLDRKSVV